MLSHETIKNMFPDSFYRRGLQYYYQFRVEQLSNEEKESHWTAKVAGSELYDVEADIFEEEIFYHCSCPAFEEYHTCKHCVAVLLEIASKLGDRPPKKTLSSSRTKEERVEEETIQPLQEKTPSPELSTDLISLFSEDEVPTASTTYNQPLQVEYSLKTDFNYSTTPLLSLEMKVGVERLYVLKNIRDFLQHIKRKEEYYFSKMFSYEPDFHGFHQEDLKIINLLLEIYESETFFNNLDKWNIQSTKQKGVTIPPIYADELLSYLQERNCKLQNGYEEYNHFKWTNSELPFSFAIYKEDEQYILSLHKSSATEYLNTYGYVLVDNAIYKLNERQQKVMEKVSAIIDLDSTSSLPIAQENIGMFFSHVLPSLKDISNVDVSEEVVKYISNPPLHAKLYLDASIDRVSAKLEYQYGEEIINPLLDDYSNEREQILVRDIKKERKLMKLIELAAFKFNGVELYIEEEEAIFSFLYDFLPRMEELAEVYHSSDIHPLLEKEKYKPTLSLDLQENANYFEINFDINDIDQNDIQKIIKSIVERKRYYRMQDGSFLPLEEESFNPIGDLFKELNISPDKMEDGPLQLPSYRSLQVEELVSRNKSVQYNSAFEQLITDIKSPSESNYKLPQSLNAELRDYQVVGFQWLKSLSHYHFGGILADDMGLGKTLQSIAFILSEWEENNGEIAPSLIISPASLVYNWQNEFTKFAPDLKVKVIQGSKSEREQLIKEFDKYDVLITSYPLVRQDYEHYLANQFSTLILDEAQAIKNYMTKTARAVKTIRKVNCFALSGTPIENSLDELWSIFDAILPGYFPNKKTFNTLSQQQISRMSRPFILRRMKRDVLKELPDKIETVHTSELTKEQKELYVGYLEKIQSEAAHALSNNGFQQNRMKILAGLTRLRQLCCHPALFIENYEGQSGKLNQLLEMIDQALKNKQRILIFSQFSSMLKIIQEKLTHLGIDPFFLDGNTPASKRVEYAERFNKGEKDIFLISLKAGGTGLNLPGADTVILYDLWWNPAVEEQATGRAHRMGQKKVVQVFRLITNGTIEEKIFSLQQKKKELIENIIHPGETLFSSLSEHEIRELLNV
jgi:SNF2 family DNA or RNA helicase